MPEVQLFGGAITSFYPSNLTDASDLRQVPDTQEVFLSNDSDLSIILEVLQLVRVDGSGDSLEAAVRYHFSSLAHDNDASSSSVSYISFPSTSSTASSLVEGPITLTGTQLVSKFNKSSSQADEVLILVALWRLPSKGTDLILTVNWPVKVHDEEGNVKDQSDGKTVAIKVFSDAVRELKVVDMGLFAG